MLILLFRSVYWVSGVITTIQRQSNTVIKCMHVRQSNTVIKCMHVLYVEGVANRSCIWFRWRGFEF